MSVALYALGDRPRGARAVGEQGSRKGLGDRLLAAARGSIEQVGMRRVPLGRQRREQNRASVRVILDAGQRRRTLLIR